MTSSVFLKRYLSQDLLQNANYCMFWSETVIMSNTGLHFSSLKHIISSMLTTLLESDYVSSP